MLADRLHIGIVNNTDFTTMLEATDSKNDPAVLEILNGTRNLCPKCECAWVWGVRQNCSRQAARVRVSLREAW